MLLCVKPHFVLFKYCKEDCTLFFPEKVAAVLQTGHYNFYSVCYKAQHMHEHPGFCYVNCLSGDWLHSEGFLVGWRRGRHRLDSDPVLPHPPPLPPLKQLQILSSLHPWSARLGAPGTLETHAPQSHHIHPHKSSLSLPSFLCSFVFPPALVTSAVWMHYEFSPCATFLSHILSSAPLQPLFLLPLLFFPKLLHPHLLIFAPQSQESVESQRLNVSPPVRIICSSLLAGLISTWTCHHEVFWTSTMTNKISFCQWW